MGISAQVLKDLFRAGHVLQLNKHNDFVSIGSVVESEGDVEFEALEAGSVLNKMEDAGNGLNIVILDACRNNPFARNFPSATSDLERVDVRKATRALHDFDTK